MKRRGAAIQFGICGGSDPALETAMPKLRTIVCSFLLCLPITACSVDGPAAADSPMEAAVVITPHAGVVQGTLRGAFRASTVAPSIHRIDVAADGQLTHFGRVSARWALPQVVLDHTAGTATVLIGTWSTTLTTPDGDVLHGQYTLHDAVVPIGLSGDFTIDADLLVLHGTGRFANVGATGLARIRGNAITGRVTVDVTAGFTRQP